MAAWVEWVVGAPVVAIVVLVLSADHFEGTLPLVAVALTSAVAGGLLSRAVIFLIHYTFIAPAQIEERLLAERDAATEALKRELSNRPRLDVHLENRHVGRAQVSVLVVAMRENNAKSVWANMEILDSNDPRVRNGAVFPLWWESAAGARAAIPAGGRDYAKLAQHEYAADVRNMMISYSLWAAREDGGGKAALCNAAHLHRSDETIETMVEFVVTISTEPQSSNGPWSGVFHLDSEGLTEVFGEKE